MAKRSFWVEQVILPIYLQWKPGLPSVKPVVLLCIYSTVTNNGLNIMLQMKDERCKCWTTSLGRSFSFYNDFTGLMCLSWKTFGQCDNKIDAQAREDWARFSWVFSSVQYCNTLMTYRNIEVWGCDYKQSRLKSERLRSTLSKSLFITWAMIPNYMWGPTLTHLQHYIFQLSAGSYMSKSVWKPKFRLWSQLGIAKWNTEPPNHLLGWPKGKLGSPKQLRSDIWCDSIPAEKH